MPFVDTPTFAGRATEVVVADCVDPDVLGGPKDDGLTLVRVDVVKTLKGARKAGRAELTTIGQRMETGKRYMMVSFGGSALGSDFVANGELAVVEIPAGFALKVLDGKTVPEQMQLVFDARRAEVTARLRQLEVEAAGLGKTAPKAGGEDGWAGEYTLVGGTALPGRGTNVRLTRDGDGYRLGVRPYEGYTFVEVRPGVLECKVLGSITRGTLKAEGREAVPVLTAELCYERFHLFGATPKAPPK
jgi:hypothetical protein